jgi:hypothetical protein
MKMNIATFELPADDVEWTSDMAIPTTPPPQFPVDVWRTLSEIDVSDRTDVIPSKSKRPDIVYLSWSNAWALLKRAFPASTYHHKPDIHHLDGTVEVEVEVMISDGSGYQTTSARLAVMNHVFNAISNPGARDINDARQRALVKALAFAGLGLNLWSSDATPVGRVDSTITPEELDTFRDLIKKAGKDEKLFLEGYHVESLQELDYASYKRASKWLEAKIKQIREEAKDSA